jgi:hypothetical protein
MFAAILRASSFVSKLAAVRRPGSSSIKVGELLPISVANDKTRVVEILNRPGWREATRGRARHESTMAHRPIA